MEKKRAIVLLITVITFIVVLVCLGLHRQIEFLQYNIDRITDNCITRIMRNLSQYHMSELDSDFYSFISSQNRSWHMQAAELLPYSSYAEDVELKEILYCIGSVIGDGYDDVGGKHLDAYLYEDIYNDQELREALEAYASFSGNREPLQIILEKLSGIVQLPSPEMREAYADEGAADAADNKEVIAEYKGQKVTKEDIMYQRQVSQQFNISAENNDNFATGQVSGDIGEKEDDLDIANRIISGIILTEEAEKSGYAATEDEVTEHMTNLKNNYEQNPEAAEIVDSFCKGVQISVDEYWEKVYEQAYGTILRGKLKQKFTDEYCAKNGIDPEKLSIEEFNTVESAYETYRQELLNAHKDEIIYNIDKQS